LSFELAWAAGFFDGEGTFSAPRRQDKKYCYLTLSVAQKDPRPLHRFVRAIGAANVTGPNKEGMHHAQLTSTKAVLAAALLEPYLSEPKREQLTRAREEVAACSIRTSGSRVVAASAAKP
jgi:hypothetical protein